MADIEDRAEQVIVEDFEQQEADERDARAGRGDLPGLRRHAVAEPGGLLRPVPLPRGHRYALDALMLEQSDALERALWACTAHAQGEDGAHPADGAPLPGAWASPSRPAGRGKRAGGRRKRWHHPAAHPHGGRQQRGRVEAEPTGASAAADELLARIEALETEISRLKNPDATIVRTPFRVVDEAGRKVLEVEQGDIGPRFSMYDGTGEAALQPGRAIAGRPPLPLHHQRAAGRVALHRRARRPPVDLQLHRADRRSPGRAERPGPPGAPERAWPAGRHTARRAARRRPGAARLRRSGARAEAGARNRV